MRQRKSPALNALFYSIDAHIGECLRMQRHLKGLSQTDLAQQLGISYQQVQKYERGQNPIDASALLLFARCLDVPVSCFFTEAEQFLSKGRNNRTLPDDIDMNLLYSEETFKLIRFFYGLPKRKRRLISLLLGSDTAKI